MNLKGSIKISNDLGGSKSISEDLYYSQGSLNIFKDILLSLRKFELENEDGELTFNALLTNYEMVCKDKTFFQDIVWSNIVIDEAHR